MNASISSQASASPSPVFTPAVSAEPSRAATWTGRVMSGLVMLFLGFDATIKVLQVSWAVEASAKLGYSAGTVFTIGAIELVCIALYLFPRTAVLGAVLWTAYLGGAVETHVRLADPLFSHTLFPTYVAALLWGGLWLREPRVRAFAFGRGAR